MKKPALLIGFCIVLSAFFGCKDTKNAQGSSNGSDSFGGKGAFADSTVYGVCGEETAMHTLQVIEWPL